MCSRAGGGPDGAFVVITSAIRVCSSPPFSRSRRGDVRRGATGRGAGCACRGVHCGRPEPGLIPWPRRRQDRRATFHPDLIFEVGGSASD